MGTVKVVLVDLSGTLHVGNEATQGAVEALKRLRQKENILIRFVTNTTKESKTLLLSRLRAIGFEIDDKEVFTSLTATHSMINAENLRPFLLLDDRALDDFKGINTDNPNAVVIGLAPEKMTYQNMNRAMRLVQSGAKLVAIHKARYFKDSQGLALGPGAFVSALEYACETQARVMGKPSTQFFLSAIDNLNCPPEHCFMIGDDVLDDIQGSQALGMKGILVKTGKYRMGDATKTSPLPHQICENFEMAVEYLLENI